jgi:hypothetical protein
MRLRRFELRDARRWYQSVHSGAEYVGANGLWKDLCGIDNPTHISAKFKQLASLLPGGREYQ